MKRKKVAVSFDSAISSSILTFATSLLGNTKIELRTFWHYLLALVVLLLIFFFFFACTEIIYNVWKKYIQRANISTDLNNELEKLKTYIEDLYKKHIVFQQSNMEEYKNVLIQEIRVIYSKISSKLCLIDQYSSSKTLKNKFIINEIALIESYKQFCMTIKDIYDIH